MFNPVSNFNIQKSLFVYLAVFLFPALIATVRSGGSVPYLLLMLFGLFLGWSVWQSLETWEKKMLFGFILFFVLISLSLINTEELREGLKRVERFVYFPLIIPMYLLLKKYRIETGKVFLYGLCLASLVMFLQAFYQYSELGYPRAVGAYNPIVLGGIAMLFAMIIVGASITITKSWQYYLLAAVSAGLAFSVSIMSGTRGAWLALPVVGLWLLWLQRKKLQKFSFISIVILIFFVIWGALQIDQVKNGINRAVSNFQSYTQNPTKTTSVGARLEMWKDAVTIWKDKPFLGTGIGDYEKHRLQLYEEGELHKSFQYGHAHSIYFDVLASAGLLGFISLLIFVFFIPFRMFYSFWINESDPWMQFYALSGMITIIAFAVFGLTESWLSRNPFVRTYLMCILVFMSSISIRKSGKKRKRKTGSVLTFQHL